MVILKEVVEASSSSDPSTAAYDDYKYDVFISFRGEDTRLSFTSHLYETLTNAKPKLTAFLDNEVIRTGDTLGPELESGIKASRSAIIVLSENYASSSWCLDELVLILEQKEKRNQIVIPIFYHVEPTHVRKQQSSFGKAMEEHMRKMEGMTDGKEKSRLAQKIESWKKALVYVANLKGLDVKGRLETEFMKNIVRDIRSRIGKPSVSVALPLLIGMKKHIDFITSWLKDGSSHTKDILTISGIGGIGKTSLAEYVYKLHRREYTSSFVNNISMRCSGAGGLLDVQKELYADLLETNSSQIQDASINMTSMIENALASTKVLLVLDDVDSLKQLDALLGSKCFHPGSKIIITTKDASLTERCATFKSKPKPTHTKCTLKCLDEVASLKLLCHHAFTCDYPIEGYKEVAKTLARYFDGHPLALEVLSRSLYDKDVGMWEDCIDTLKTEPHFEIKRVLQVSFDSLPFNSDKELFKHIACFFVGEDKDVTETILKACKISTRSGIANLIDRHLLSIKLNKLKMHSLIQEMGRDLVCQESPNKAWKRSRIWCHEDSFKVLEQKEGSTNIIGLALDMRMLEEEKLSGSLQLETDALNKMDNLKLLQLNFVKISGSYENISKELRWLCMRGFQFKDMPSTLPMENLVVLDMSHSNIESFDVSYSISRQLVTWVKGLTGSSSVEKKMLRSLKILDLSFCDQLHSVGGFLELPILEKLIISNCTSLIQVSESIGHCVELVFIDLSNCKKLKVLPSTIENLKKVKTFLSNGCDNLIIPPEIGRLDTLKRLEADKADINSQTSSSAIPRQLNLFISSLPISLVKLSLKNNNLSTESFPMEFSSMSVLKNLYLDGNPIISMPSCLSSLPRLKGLSMKGCTNLETIEHPPISLRKLALAGDFKVQRIIFSPEMSTLDLQMVLRLDVPDSSWIVEGVIKIQPLAHVEDEVLHSLGWSDMVLLKYQHSMSSTNIVKPSSTIQMYYEFGIFSSIYAGKDMPNFISCRGKGSRGKGSLSMAFTIPSSLHKLIGFNVCCVPGRFRSHSKTGYCSVPIIKVNNITKSRTWIYRHFFTKFSVADDQRLIYLSHWMFGKNEMEDGDQVTISIIMPRKNDVYSIMECGLGLVYDDGRMKEDVLSYYKSWNHIIGGDLSHFQTTTGEYILNHFFFLRPSKTLAYYRPFLAETSRTKTGSYQRFRAFSQQKSDLLLEQRENCDDISTQKWRNEEVRKIDDLYGNRGLHA